jgi:peptide-methionine (S)-S-oxide reductase
VYWLVQDQALVINAAIREAAKSFSQPIVTEIAKLEHFYPAEDYHQNYFAKNPNQAYCRALIPPKLKKLGLLPL